MNTPQTQHVGEDWLKGFEACGFSDANWLSEVRSTALDRFLQHGFPTQREEAWRYTDLTKAYQRSQANLGNGCAADTDSAAVPELLDIPNAVKLVFVNGWFDRTNSSLAEVEGLRISVFSEDLPDNSGVKNALIDLAQQSPLTALNTAFATDGVDIAIDSELDLPVYIAWVNTRHDINTFPRCTIRLARGATASIVEHHVSAGAAFSNAVTRIDCAESASLQYTKLQDEHHDAQHLSLIQPRLETNSMLKLNHVDLGAAMARTDILVELLGGGASASANGLFLVDRKRHADNHVYLRHLSPHTTSSTVFRGVLTEQAKGVFNGSIYVEQDAQKTDAQLANHNLLLSSDAEINTKPELEIYADDVKCAHGATTGRLDSNALFYLLTRGIPVAEAEKILIAAFAEEITINIDITAVNERIHRAVHDRLDSTSAGES